MAYLELPGDLRVFKIKLPMRVKTSNKKKQALNLNVYRNLHHRSLHAQKKKFEELAKKLLRDIPPLGVIHLHYEVFVETRRRLDVMNVGSIVDKYFSDTLTAVGIIADDDFKNIPSVSFSYGGIVDKEHILVTITEIEKRKESKPMRVLLDQADIQKALTTYVAIMGVPNATGVRLESDVEGIITAEVTFYDTSGDLKSDTKPIEEETPKPKRGRGGRPAGSRNRTKKGAANVDETLPASADVGSSGVTETPTGEAPDGDSTEGGVEPKTKPSKNLFGDKETSSSEDDDGASDGAALDTTPKPAVKKGSIFDDS